MHSVLRHVLLLALAFTAANAAQAIAPAGPSVSSPAPQTTVAVGSSVTFSVTAKGTGTLKYQWQFGTGNITGATKSSYTIAKVTPSNVGNYRVIVSQTVNKVVSSTFSTYAHLTVTPNFAGKYNIAVIEYNATDVMNGRSIQNGQSSGGALYGSETVKGSGISYTFTTTLLDYLGSDVTGATQTTTGTINSGNISIKNSGNDFTFTVVTGNDTITPIGFIGKGTPRSGSDNTNDGFIIGLNATTTAPKSAAACAGNYTVIIISYNATAVSKKNVAQDDGDAAIGNATVTTGGAFKVTQYRYADGGGDTLGQAQVITGQISSSGTVSSVMVQTGHGTQSHAISLKFVSLNGQVIGFTGTFKPVPGSQNESDSGILIGIRGLFTPLGPSFF